MNLMQARPQSRKPKMKGGLCPTCYTNFTRREPCSAHSQSTTAQFGHSQLPRVQKRTAYQLQRQPADHQKGEGATGLPLGLPRSALPQTQPRDRFVSASVLIRVAGLLNTNSMGRLANQLSSVPSLAKSAKFCCLLGGETVSSRACFCVTSDSSTFR